MSQVRRVLRRAAPRVIDRDIVKAVREERDADLRGGVLEVRDDASVKARSLGGLHVYQAWIGDIAKLMDDEREPGGETLRDLLPRGVLLVGLPGCGKSLAVEFAAARMGVPLLQLHMGRVMGRLLGDSERNLEDALEVAKASAPCILWIDELEKAVGGMGNGDEGGGTGGRILGRLLSWMQDNRSVMVFATANSIEYIPTELLRRGRFDEHFLLELPNNAERKEILQKAVDSIERELPEEHVTHIADKMTADYSGADLAALVREAARRAWLTDRRDTRLERDDFEAVRKSGFKPQAQQFKAKFDDLRKKLTELGFKNASTSDGKPVSREKESPTPDISIVAPLDGRLNAYAEGIGKGFRFGNEWVAMLPDRMAERRGFYYKLSRDGDRVRGSSIGNKTFDFHLYIQNNAVYFSFPNGPEYKIL